MTPSTTIRFDAHDLAASVEECSHLARELLEHDREGSAELLDRLFELFNFGPELICSECDFVAEGATEGRMVIKPSDRLLEMLAALRARKLDLGIIDTGMHRGTLS